MKLEYYLKMRWLASKPKKTARVIGSLQENLQAEQCLYKGDPLPVSLMPLMLNQKEYNLLKRTSDHLAAIIEKTIESIFTSARIKEYISYEDIPQTWLDINPGYKKKAVLARLDAIYNGTTLKYTEINTDNPEAIAWTDVIRRVIVTHPFYQKLAVFAEEEYNPTIHQSIFKAAKKIYGQFRKGEEPVVAFVTYKDHDSASEAALLANFFSKQGLRAFRADPQSFQVKDGKAYAGSKKVDMVIRCLKAQELLKYPQKIDNFVNLYSSGAFCMVNSFRSVYGSEKSLFALMSNPDFHHLYTPEELQIIKAHVPWTRTLAEAETVLPSGKKVALNQFITEHRTKLVLKPSKGYGGEGIVIGLETEQQEWEKILTRQYGNKEWVVQEYVPVPTIPLPCRVKNRIKIVRQYFNISTFTINGKFAGVTGRISDTPVINVNKGGDILPVLRY